MSISGALSNALSGLTASSLNAQVVANNLANLTTPGYAPRSLELISRSDGGGVKVVGVTRQEDAALIGDRRAASSELAYSSSRAEFFASLERLTGTPGDPGSLTERFAAFESSLITAASKPEETSRLQAVSLRAVELATKISDVSRGIQDLRTAAETRIGQAVGDMNALLQQVQSLNARIVDANTAGHPRASFEDQRRVVIDKLAEYLPIRTAQRGNGAVALYTPGGIALLDNGNTAEFSFAARNVVLPHMTLEDGLLSGLFINGQEFDPSSIGSPVHGGKLAALFEQRDVLATDAQTQLDAVARDLILRFQDPGIDTTRPAGAAGLFTDAGNAFDNAAEVGIAGRIAVNPLVIPEQGGAYWRLREGLGTVTSGNAGNGRLLNDLVAALDGLGSLASGGLGATERTAAGHAAALISHFGVQRLAADQSVVFATSQHATLEEVELGLGVDSDTEMQKLLLIQQAYSANARMIEVIGEMMDTLMRI